MADEPDGDEGMDIASMLFDAPTNASSTDGAQEEENAGTGEEGSVVPAANAGKENQTTQPSEESAAPPEETPPEVTPAPAPDPTLATALASQGEAIKALLEKSSGGEKSTPAAPKFNVSLPDKIIQAMASEDVGERAAATNILVNNMLNFMWDNFQTELQARFTDIPKMIEGHMSRADQSRQIYNDFYQKYPALNKPELMPVVQQVARNVIAAKGQNFQWNEKVRDEIGEAVLGLIKSIGGAAPPAAKPKPKEPPFAAGKGTRGASPAGDKSPFLDSIGM